jgi:anti-sigma regulatory factor (Ser/Thr protein kinase)
VRSDAANLPALTQFLNEFWQAAALPAALASPFELALEELFVNVAMHGSKSGSAPWVEVSLDLADGGVTMTVEDDGPPFDPLSLPTPNVAASLSERPIGGLGIYLVRQMMDAVTYSRVGTRNQLRMTKHFAD